MSWKNLRNEIEEEFAPLARFDKCDPHSTFRTPVGPPKVPPPRQPHWIIRRGARPAVLRHSRG